MSAYLNCRRRIDVFILILCVFSVYFASLRSSIPVDDRVFLSAATISATLLGFSLAAGGFLIGRLDGPQFHFVRREKSLEQLIGILQSTLWRFCGMIFVSLIAFSMYRLDKSVALSLFLGWLIYSSLALICLIWALAAILRLSAKPPR